MNTNTIKKLKLVCNLIILTTLDAALLIGAYSLYKEFELALMVILLAIFGMGFTVIIRTLGVIKDLKFEKDIKDWYDQDEAPEDYDDYDENFDCDDYYSRECMGEYDDYDSRECMGEYDGYEVAPEGCAGACGENCCSNTGGLCCKDKFSK